MTNLEVYKEILEKYKMVIYNSENVLLVEKDKMQDFNKVAVLLSR